MSVLGRRSLDEYATSDCPFAKFNIDTTCYLNAVAQCCCALAKSDIESDDLKRKLDLMFQLEDELFKQLGCKGVSNLTPFCDHVENLFNAHGVSIPAWYHISS